MIFLVEVIRLWIHVAATIIGNNNLWRCLKELEVKLKGWLTLIAFSLRYLWVEENYKTDRNSIMNIAFWVKDNLGGEEILNVFACRACFTQ